MSRLKVVRLSLGKTQKEFSEALGTVQGVISDIENGRKEPSRSLLINAVRKFRVDATWLLTGEGAMFLPQIEPEQPEEDDFPDDPEQGMAYLDSVLGMLVRKGVIDKSDIPPPLPGVKRVDYSSQMTLQTRKRLYKDLAKAQREVERIEAEIEKLEPEVTYNKEAPLDSEAHEPEPSYGVDEEMQTPLMGRVAAGPPLETERWPDEWRPVRLRHGEAPNTHYLLEVVGTSMTDAGIPNGSLILVRRAEVGEPGEVVVAYERDEGVTLKRLQEREGRLMLVWQDGSGRVRELSEETRIQGMFVRVVE